MRAKCLVAMFSITLSPVAIAQDVTHKPKISSESLTKEQAAVYRTVLQDFLKDSKDKLKLSNVTEPLDESADSPSHRCPKTPSSTCPYQKLRSR